MPCQPHQSIEQIWRQSRDSREVRGRAWQELQLFAYETIAELASSRVAPADAVLRSLRGAGLGRPVDAVARPPVRAGNRAQGQGCGRKTPGRPCGLDGCGGGKVSDCLVTLEVERVWTAAASLLDTQ